MFLTYPGYSVRPVRACSCLHASAAASRREMEGCEWKNHSTHFEGMRSARF